LVLAPIVINGQLRIVEVWGERCPPPQTVVERLRYGRTFVHTCALQNHPGMQRFGDGTRASLAKFQSILGGEITRLALDIVQLADVAQGIFGNLASTGNM
jgi:hypothetical protein